MKLIFVALAAGLAMSWTAPVAADDVPTVRARASAPASLPLLAPIEPKPDPGPDKVELPWVWRHIRVAVRKTERALPNHRTDEFYIVFTPVRVSNGFDTVAGLGVEGQF